MSEDNSLTEGQKAKMLKDIWKAIAGDPFDGKKPGLVTIVERHSKTLYGEEGDGGLVKQADKAKRFAWMAVGFGAAVNLLLGGLVAIKEFFSHSK